MNKLIIALILLTISSCAAAYDQNDPEVIDLAVSSLNIGYFSGCLRTGLLLVQNNLHTTITPELFGRQIEYCRHAARLQYPLSITPISQRTLDKFIEQEANAVRPLYVVQPSTTKE